VLANASGKKIGSVGRPLPGSAEVAVAAWSEPEDDFVRDGRGHLIHARLDEAGMLVARLGHRSASDVAHIDPRRVLRDAFASGDTWFVTGDFMKVDAVGDYWFVDRRGNMIKTRMGAVASTRIEDAIYAYTGVALCIAIGHRDGDHDIPIAAIELHDALDLAALSAAVIALPEYARPRRVRVVERLPMTDGFRAIKHGLRDLDAVDGPNVFEWDPRAQRYVATVGIQLVG
jgi:putative long chain acyl-CoA synthase